MSVVPRIDGKDFPDGSGEDPLWGAQRPSAPPSRPASRPASQWGALKDENFSLDITSRSRTNTLEHKIGPIPLSVLTSQRSSWDTESLADSIHSPTDRIDGFAQILREKTSKLLRRRQSKHARAIASVDRCEEKNLPNHAPVLPAHDYLRHTRFVSAGNHYPGSRPNISVPYNFQHLTHTDSRQFKDLDKASEDELANELSAIQAVQKSQRRLQGIAAHDLSEQSSACSSPLRHSPALRQSSYTPTLTSPSSVYSDGGRSTQELTNTPPRTPPPQDYPSHNTSHFTNSPYAPVVPPPRKSSKAAARVRGLSIQHHQETLQPPHEDRADPLTPIDHSRSPYFTAPQTPLDVAPEEWAYPTAPHAMTTPDDSACTIKPALHQPSLAGVAEDDSHSITVKGSRPSTPGSGLRHAKSFPYTISSSRPQDPHSPVLGNPRSLSVNEGLSQSHSLLPFVGQPFDDIPAHPRQSRQVPCSPLTLDASWEDDIDFCYEHAAEADCNFDWTRPSLDAPGERESYGASYDKPEPLQIKKRSDSSPHQLLRLQTSLSVSKLSLTDSANSSIASIAGPTTPANPFFISVPGDHRKASISPFVYGTCSFNDEPELEELRPDSDASANFTEHMNPLHTFRFDPPPAEDDSPRGSRSPISKSNSHDSFWSSPRASSASKRMENVSTDSLPDLVYSQSRYALIPPGAQNHVQSQQSGASQHGRTKSEALSPKSGSLNAAFQSLRKRSASTTAGSAGNGSARGSSYSLFPPVPAVRVTQ